MKKWIQKILFNTTPPKNGWVDAKDEVGALIEIFNSTQISEKKMFFVIDKQDGISISLYKSSELITTCKNYEELLLTISYFGFKYFENKWD
jgi:hypothetical protein